MYSYCKFFSILILYHAAESKSRSLDPDCTKKFPDCILSGRTNVNTACENKGCGPKFKGCTELPPDAKFRQAVLDRHNELRNKIASGGDTTGNNEAASNMMALSYDLALEYTAICHVHGCRMKHDVCRGTKQFPSAGQNLAMQITTSSTSVQSEDVNIDVYKGFVDDWYNEIKLGDFKSVIDSYNFDHSTGHFTALIWATTTHVGCARAVDRSKKNSLTVHMTCNYAPSGNVIGKPMYTKGTGCSSCPSGASCNSKYTALCGEIDTKAINENANPYRTADIARGKQNPLHFYSIHLHNMIFLTIFISLLQ